MPRIEEDIVEASTIIDNQIIVVLDKLTQHSKVIKLLHQETISHLFKRIFLNDNVPEELEPILEEMYECFRIVDNQIYEYRKSELKSFDYIFLFETLLNVIFQNVWKETNEEKLNNWSIVSSILLPTVRDMLKAVEFLENGKLYHYIDSICDKLGGHIPYTNNGPIYRLMLTNEKSTLKEVPLNSEYPWMRNDLMCSIEQAERYVNKVSKLLEETSFNNCKINQNISKSTNDIFESLLNNIVVPDNISDDAIEIIDDLCCEAITAWFIRTSFSE